MLWSMGMAVHECDCVLVFVFVCRRSESLMRWWPRWRTSCSTRHHPVVLTENRGVVTRCTAHFALWKELAHQLDMTFADVDVPPRKKS